MRAPLLRQLPAVVAVAAALLAVASAPAATAAEPTARACTGMVSRSVLPAWARGGFSEAAPVAPHAIGRSGAIAAIVFGDPLQSPPAASGRRNKILWVARREPGARSALRLRAQRMRGRSAVGAAVSRTVAGGPGPSTIDVPAAGCWRFTLSWSGQSDTLDLRYR